jgi:hypothetical protein
MPHLDDPQVRLDEVDLVAERVRRLAEPGERRAQVVDERLEHRLGARRVGLHERDDVRERVEQEVRLHLRLEQAQLRLGGAVLGLDLPRLHREELLEDQRDQRRQDDARDERARACSNEKRRRTSRP